MSGRLAVVHASAARTLASCVAVLDAVGVRHECMLHGVQHASTHRCSCGLEWPGRLR